MCFLNKSGQYFAGKFTLKETVFGAPGETALSWHTFQLEKVALKTHTFPGNSEETRATLCPLSTPVPGSHT